MTNPNFAAAGPAGGAPVSKTKWIVQLVVAVLCFFNIITIVLAILGLTKADTDLATANKYYKWGWIAYAIWAVLVIVGNIVLAALGFWSASFETY
jgi:uncharacterized membrane protein YidH (DUF202 family)